MEKLLNVKDLAEWLGVSTRTVYEWTHIEYIPHYKFPKGVRFKYADIEKWLNKKKVKGRNRYFPEL